MNKNVFMVAGFLVVVVVFTAVGWLGWRLQGNDYAQPSSDSDNEERRVQVVFQSHVLGGLPVRFSPNERIQYVTPGVDHKNTYLFQNLSDQTVYFTPIHSVAPADAARHYSMSVCFCFYDQKMPPHSSAEFTLVYRLDPALSVRTNPVFINYNLKRIDASQFRLDSPDHQPGSELQLRSALPITSDWIGG